MALILLALAALAPMASWLFSETRLVPAAGLIGPRTAAFTIIRLSEDDPGVRDLVTYTVARLPVVQQGPLAGYHWPFQYGTEILPVNLVITEEMPESPPREGTPPVPALTYALCCSHTHGFNQVAFVHFKKYAIEKGEVIERHGDRDVLGLSLVDGPALGSPPRPSSPAPSPSSAGRAPSSLPPSPPSGSPSGSPSPATVGAKEANEPRQAWLSFLSNTFVLSGSLPAAETMMDRIVARSSTFQGTGSLARMHARLDPTQDAIGAVGREHGEIRRLLEAIRREDLLGGTTAGPRLTPELVAAIDESVSAVGFELDVVGSDRLDARLLVACRDSGTAQAVRRYLDLLVREMERAGLLRGQKADRLHAETSPSPEAAGREGPAPEWIVETRFTVLHLRRLLPLSPQPNGDALPRGAPPEAP